MTTIGVHANDGNKLDHFRKHGGRDVLQPALYRPAGALHCGFRDDTEGVRV